MSIMEYNGGSMVAMCGKNCVAIATDTRFGLQNKTVGKKFKKVFKINEKTFLGLTGLATDIQTVYQKVKFRTNLYKLREEREIKPSSLTNMLSSMLYEARFAPFFTEPIVAGLEGEKNNPYISTEDLIGNISNSSDFLVGGTAGESLFGICESLFKENMNCDELFEVISQCLLASVDRDCFSGWGGVVYILTPDKLIKKKLKVRQD